MKKVKRLTGKRIIIAVMLSVGFFSAALVSFTIGRFKGTLDEFSGAIVRGDQLAARDGFQNLQYFYELNKKLPVLSNITGKYFFKDAQYYKSAYDYLTGNYDKVINELKNSDGYWAHFIRANSRWRQAQGIMEQSLQMNEELKQEMQKLATGIVLSTKDDYEQAVRKDPNSSLPPKWNYDLTTDAAAMMGALMPKQLKIKKILGRGGKEDKGPSKEKGKDQEGKGSQDLDKKMGDKPSSDKKPGPKREG